MKKLLKSLVLFAAAAMALTSCENEVINEGIETNDTYTFNFVAGAPESRTSVTVDGTTATFAWAEEGETFTFVQNTTEGLKKGTNVTFANNNGLAEITATFTEAESPIVAVYPANAWVDNDNFNKAKLIVAKDQNILGGTFDPNADLLVSEVVNPDNVTATHSLKFGRVVAVGKMTLKKLPVVGSEVINKVNFSIDSENALTGRLYIDLETAEVGELGYYQNAYKEVNLKDGNMAVEATNDIYFTCMPATVAAGETFTVVVTTNVATYTHSVTIPEGKSIQFAAGRVSSFGVDMTNADRALNSGLALPWSESFDSEDLSKYDVVNGGSNTKVWPEALAGGEAGEILIGKNGGSMTATFASDGTAKTLNFWFKSNKNVVVLSSATEGVTITKLTSTGYTVALAEGVELFELTLENNTDDNARVDDIVLTEEAPKIASLSIVGQKISFTAGDEFVFDGTVNAVYENGVTEEINDYTVDRSAVDMANAGEYTVTVTYNGVNATYTINVAAAGVKTNTTVLTNATGTFENNTITWKQDDVTIVQAKGSGTSTVNSSYKTLSSARIYQGHTLTFSCATNITNIEIVTKGTNYGKTATVNVGTLNNPKTSGCTITWTGSAKEVVITNGTGSGGSQIQPSQITITYEVSGQGGGETPEPEPEPEEPETPGTGDESEVVATFEPGKISANNTTKTDDKENSWVITTDATYFGTTSGYIQVGSNGTKASHLTLTSTIENVKSVTVYAAAKASTNATINVYIGSTLIGTSEVLGNTASSGGTEFTVENTSNVSGALTIKVSRPSEAAGALYFNSAKITYAN